jgi:hypothetical protein
VPPGNTTSRDARGIDLDQSALGAPSAVEASVGEGTPMKNISDRIANAVRKVASAGDTASLLSVLEPKLQELDQLKAGKQLLGRFLQGGKAES